MYDVELHNLYSNNYFQAAQIKEVEMVWDCGSQGTEKKYTQGSGGGKGKKPSTWHIQLRWAVSNKMDLKGTGCNSVDCIHVTQKRDQWRLKAAMNRRGL